MKRLLSALLLAATSVIAGPADKTEPPKLAWAPPKLENPVTLDLSQEAKWRSFKLKKDQDYIVQMPKDRPWIGELNLYGGRNVVLIGGEVRIPSPEEDSSFGKGEDGKEKRSRRAVYLKGQTGIIHVEGLLISGKGLHEGFNLDEREPGCVVQLQNIRCETLHGSFKENHADVIQSWAGPAVLRVDRLTGFTTYQGFFLLPNQHFALDKGGFLPTKWDFRHINLIGTAASAYLLWCPDNHGFPIEIEDVWVKPSSKNAGDRDAFLWPKPKQKGDKTWEKVQVGLPPEGEFVPEGAVGLVYASPGYED